jgi:hypothetical protein
MHRPRHIFGLCALLLVIGACSSSEPMALELKLPMAPPEQPFVATGLAVDDGAVCPDGTWLGVRNEDMDGQEMSHEQWADVYDAAMATDGVAEARAIREFVCADGSGTLEIEDHAYLDFSVIDASTFGSEPVQWGTFTISGTGDYTSLSGSGDEFADFGQERYVFSGEVTNG